MHRPWRLGALPCLLACAGAPEETGETAADPCAGRAEVTWSGFGDAFFGEWCRSCHSVDAADRAGAPSSINFDTIDDARTYAESIRRTVLEQDTMPPVGEVPADDRALLEAFLDCGL